MLDRHCPIDRDERIYADNWQDEPIEQVIARNSFPGPDQNRHIDKFLAEQKK